ncbi:MAG: sugar phosphate nucleotidyltransferase, partial [Gammaproteobacteria bacterium]
QLPSHVLVLAGDHAYRMDYAAMLEGHLRSGAQVSVGCIRVPVDEARAFGVMQVDRDERIRRFTEKPVRPEPIPGHDDIALASMGIYLFDRDFLLDLLAVDAVDPRSSHDFGKDVIPTAIRNGLAYAYSLRDLRNPLRQGYWRDVGTIDAYRQANLEMAGDSPRLDPADAAWPVRTGARPAQAAPQRRGDRSIVADGCRTSGAELSRCVLFADVHVGARSMLTGSVVLAGATIGTRCAITNAVIEQGCEIPHGTVIGFDEESDRERFHVAQGGTVLVTPEALQRRARIDERVPPRPAARALRAAVW